MKLIALCKSQLDVGILPTQHSTSHQDVEKGFSIAAVVKLGPRSIKKLCNGFQISTSLVQTLYDALLKLARVKSLLFICWKHTHTRKQTWTHKHTHTVYPQALHFSTWNFDYTWYQSDKTSVHMNNKHLWWNDTINQHKPCKIIGYSRQ